MVKAVGGQALGVRTDCVYVATEEEAAAKKRLIRAGLKFGGVGFEAVGSLKIEHKENIGMESQLVLKEDTPNYVLAGRSVDLQHS